MSKEEKSYQIKNISEIQLKVITDALEMYTRLGILQFGHLLDHMFNYGENVEFSDGYTDNREEIQQLLMQVRNLIVSTSDTFNKYPEYGHWSLGIGSSDTPTVSKISYEIERDINSNVILGDKKPKLRGLSTETSIIVREENLRSEKISQIIEKLKIKNETTND